MIFYLLQAISVYCILMITIWTTANVLVGKAIRSWPAILKAPPAPDYLVAVDENLVEYN